MALVKTSELAGRPAPRATPAAPVPQPTIQPIAQRRAQDRSRARREKAAERIGAATEELASGVAEAAAAAEELARALAQIASSAEEAAGAAQQSQGAIESLGATFAQARDRAEHSRRRTDALQSTLIELGTQIEASAAFVQENAARQLRSVEVVATLEAQAANIGEITRTVGDISDQTNLLALNAAIEAARAGEHGRGFAVVAEEVRAFAEQSESSARDVQALVDRILTDVRTIATRVRAAAEGAEGQARDARAVIATLDAVRTEMGAVAEGAQAILIAAVEAEGAAREAQRGAEQVAGAAEEQSAATAEAQRAVQQQTISLDESQRTAQALAAMAESLQSGNAAGSAAEEVASAAEQLSAVVQEMSGAAAQITAALDQIGRGAQAQAAATQQSSAAMAQIERAAGSTSTAAARAVEWLGAVSPRLSEGRASVDAFSNGMEASLAEMRAVVELIGSLEGSGRRIEKIVDSIALVAVQTNMLAVSGSVEAARAGEAGRGFAVVSTDIRELARDAAANADRMKDVVRDIRDQVAVVRADLDSVAAASVGEIGKNRVILDRLAATEADLVGLRTGSDEVLAGAKTVLGATREVAAGTRQIAAAAEEASGAASQASTAARQQARGAEDLAAAIEEIASLADELRTTGA
jgi:methyl-accepting chemotaxis protein